MSAQSPSKIPSPRAHGYHYDHDSSLLLNQDALEAHRQVLEMSATIEILTRDFDQQQKELIEAYKRLNEYALWDPQRQVSNSSITQPIVTNNSMNSGFKDMENYENEKAMEEYKRVSIIYTEKMN
jgi:negative regulator of sigma E activity